MASDRDLDEMLDAAVGAMRGVPLPPQPIMERLVVQPPRRSAWKLVVAAIAIAASVGALVLPGIVGRTGSRTNVLLADVARDLRGAKTIRFRLRMWSDDGYPFVYSFAMNDADRVRIEGKSLAAVIDARDSKGILLVHATDKLAFPFAGDDEASRQTIAVAGLVHRLQSAGKLQAAAMESETIDGIPCTVFRVNLSGADFTIAVDPVRRVPVRMQTVIEEFAKRWNVVMERFELATASNPSLFSLQPPDGYLSLEGLRMSLPAERDLAFMLGRLAERNGGRFPESLELGELLNLARQLGRQPRLEAMSAGLAIVRGVIFVQQLAPENRWQYLGAGKSTKDNNSIIARWNVGDGSAYRAVFSDLSVRPTDPPAIPDRKER